MMVTRIADPIFLLQLVDKLTVANIAEDVLELVSSCGFSRDMPVRTLNLCLRAFIFTVHRLF